MSMRTNAVDAFGELAENSSHWIARFYSDTSSITCTLGPSYLGRSCHAPSSLLTQRTSKACASEWSMPVHCFFLLISIGSVAYALREQSCWKKSLSVKRPYLREIPQCFHEKYDADHR